MLKWIQQRREMADIRAKIARIDHAIEERDHRADVRSLILDLAQAQADIIIALAASRIDDDALVKDSLRQGSDILQRVIRELQRGQHKDKLELETDSAALEDLRKSLERE